MTPHCEIISEFTLLKGELIPTTTDAVANTCVGSQVKWSFWSDEHRSLKKGISRSPGRAAKQLTGYFETSFSNKSTQKQTKRVQKALPRLDAELYSPSNNDRQYLAKKHDPWWNFHVVSQLEVRGEHHC